MQAEQNFSYLMQRKVALSLSFNSAPRYSCFYDLGLREFRVFIVSAAWLVIVGVPLSK